MLCMAGFLTFALCVHVCICQQNISKNIEPINFVFGGSLPSDPGRKPFYFEKILPWGKGVCVCVGGGSNFAPNDKR